jgi:hypothetical protein
MPGEGVWRCGTCGEWDDAGHDGALCGVCEDGRLVWAQTIPVSRDPQTQAQVATIILMRDGKLPYA